MKRTITFLFTLMALAVVSVQAQFTTDGVYNIKNAGNQKFMTNPGVEGAIIKMTDASDATIQFIIKANGDNYNIFTLDGKFLAASVSGAGKLIENTPDNMNSNTAGALVNFIDEGANPYRFESNSNLGLRAWNGQKNSDTQVGMGTSTSWKYKWNLIRVGDIPEPAPIVSITQPTDGENILPGANITLQASATAEDGQTLTSVEFLVDGEKVGDGALNGEVYEYAWTAPATPGEYAITAKATSSANAETTSAAVTVDVSSKPASVTLKWPSEAITILPNKQVKLKADATAASGATVTKVEFFAGADLLGEGTLNGGVYELDYNFNSISTFAITAKVTDSENNNETSDVVNIETSLTTSIVGMYLNFETGDATSEWLWKSTKYEGAGLSYMSYDPAKARSAANNVFEIDFSSKVADGADNIHYQTRGLDALPASGMVYIRIHYADDNAAEAPAAGPTLWSSAVKPTPGTAAANDDGTFKSKTWNKYASAMGADGSSVTIYPALRMDANSTAGKLFFDDVVMYYDPNSSGTDATAPTAPSNLNVEVASATQINLSWDEGMDVGIGIDSTYIFRTTVSGSSLGLVNYVGYSSKGLPVGLDVVGDWTVVGVVPLGTTSFADNTVIDGGTTDYNYAVVHKDYAYNYSEGTLGSSGTATSNTTIDKAEFISYGVQGAIELVKLTEGSNLSIYNLSGVQVYNSKVLRSQLTVNVPQGVYFVKSQGETQKVIVR